MNSTEIWRAFARHQSKVEKRYLTKVYSSLNKQMATVAEYYKQYGHNRTLADLDSIVTYDAMLPIIRSLYTDAGVKNAENAYLQVKAEAEKGQKAKGQMGFSALWYRRIIGYFRLFLLNKSVVPITETTKKHIRDVLEEANKEGWGVDKTVRELKDKDLSRKRAELIVRTETVRASNLGGMVGAAEMGLKLTKEWIAIRDSRTRPDHKKLDGQIVDFEAYFVVPESLEKLLYPGDPEAAAKEVIRCRCTLGFIPVRDTKGNLIRHTYSIV